MSHKTLGYILLTLGITLIIVAVISAFLVFTKRTEPVGVFELDSVTIDPASLAPQVPSGPSLPSQIEIGSQTIELPFEQKEENESKNTEIELFSGKALSDSINFVIHLVFMGFIASIGSRLANIGTQLIRPIIIKAKTIKQRPSDVTEIT